MQNEYEEDEHLLHLTHYDRKAVEYWSTETLTNQGVNVTVDGLADVICKPHNLPVHLGEDMHNTRSHLSHFLLSHFLHL